MPLFSCRPLPDRQPTIASAAARAIESARIRAASSVASGFSAMMMSPVAPSSSITTSGRQEDFKESRQNRGQGLVGVDPTNAADRARESLAKTGRKPSYNGGDK
jgi:hypothetical protein